MNHATPPHQGITAFASPKIMETVVKDDQKAERVKVTVHRGAIGSAAVVVPVITATETVPNPPPASTMMSPDEALQVLALAQRTAENHITAANRQAEKVRSEAQAAAEQIRLEAHAYAEKVRAEADRLRDEARAAAELRSREADAQAAEIRRRAESALADARTEAERIVADGRDRADQLDLRAKQRYEDAVGSLAIKREALQKQIEALGTFDSDYRHRLASFMHTQLRALWIEQSGAHAVPDVEAQMPGGPVGCPEPS
jgi:vacuolar-type H+-ATPase subunit H